MADVRVRYVDAFRRGHYRASASASQAFGGAACPRCAEDWFSMPL